MDARSRRVRDWRQKMTEIHDEKEPRNPRIFFVFQKMIHAPHTSALRLQGWASRHGHIATTHDSSRLQ